MIRAENALPEPFLSKAATIKHLLSHTLADAGSRHASLRSAGITI